MERFAKWESTIFIDKCDICGRFVLVDKAQGTCKSIGDQLVNDKNTGERKCGICASARKRALERHKSDYRTGDLHPGLRDPWSHSNGMLPSLVPQELQVLTMVEKLMIALVAPLMRIKFLWRGTRDLNGNGIAFRQPVENLARALPRYVSETGILLVVRGLVADEDRQNVSSGAREWKLRRAPVRDALQYLITHSPPYMDPRNGVVIDEGRLTCIPEDGSVFDAVIRQQQRAAFQQWRTSNSFQQCADCNLPLSECSCHIRLQSIINEIKILQSEMICLQGSPVGFDTTFSSPMSSDISTASTFVTQVEEVDSFQPVAIFVRGEEVSMSATHGHVLEEAQPGPVPRARLSDSARRLPSKFV
jgi:hypothetical protein